jgi:hypothetical protein
MACREAIALVADLLVGKIKVASDCLDVVKGIWERIVMHILIEIKETAGVCVVFIS